MEESWIYKQYFLHLDEYFFQKKELRMKQHYFYVSEFLQDIILRFIDIVDSKLLDYITESSTMSNFSELQCAKVMCSDHC